MCATAAAPIVRRTCLFTCVFRARPRTNQIAFRVAACIEAGQLWPSPRWLHPGPDRLPYCSSKCRAALRIPKRNRELGAYGGLSSTGASTMPSSPRPLRRRCDRMRIRRPRTGSRLMDLNSILGIREMRSGQRARHTWNDSSRSAADEVQRSEIAHNSKRARMLRSKHSSHHVEQLAELLLRLRTLALPIEREGEVVHR
jgi:hypothetical protein